MPQDPAQPIVLTAEQIALAAALTAEKVALQAARQALHEFTNSHENKIALKEIIREAVGEAIGTPVGTPEEREKLRSDMIFLRQWRENMDTIRAQGLASITKWLVIGFIGLLMLGLGVKLGVKLPG